MAWSKSTRIIVLLVIDSLFFVLELVTGYAVHSLALVADSFHMLNDVISLLIGLWAVKMANKQAADTPKMYTYGYQRAETLGALVNGVFLVALCVTIFLEAISRFVEPQAVNNPQFVLVVGCLGLLSNIVGLVLFHDHGHSHGGGGHGHSHGHENEVRDAEEGHAGHSHGEHDVHDHTHDEESSVHAATEASGSTVVGPFSPTQGKRRHSRTASRGALNYEEYNGPVAFRNAIIQTAGRIDEDEDAMGADSPSQHEPLLAGKNATYGSADQRKSFDHADHKHAQPREPGKGGGHSHGDLNMKGIFLHVLGDALGNIGVIASALIIWLTDFEGRYYIDPAVSLLITLIILGSAIPLCKAASRILLQAVPSGIEVDDIQDDIESMKGVESCHHLHVWQLTDSKLVASLHVRVTFNFKGEGSQRYMQLAAAINECLHQYGIHSSTIQPEFHADSSDITEQDDHEVGSHTSTPRSDSLRNGDKRCLLDCDEDCGGGKSCCPPEGSQQKDGSHDGHGHSH